MKFIKRSLLLLFVGLVLFSGYQFYRGYQKYTDAIAELPLAEAVAQIREKENYTDYQDIPLLYFQAVVAVEDRRFYQHHGFDIIGTARAIINDIKAGALLEGGSTISQQLAKNMYFPMDNTLERKIAEVFLALELEREYEKEEILALYANGIYFGSGNYCIYDATMDYFGKIPAEMTPDECTLLAGIPNAPSVYAPDKNPELARKRQQKVISCMVECGYIKENQIRIENE